MEIDSQVDYTNQQYHSKTTYNPSQITNNNKINIINCGGYLVPVSLNSNKGKGRPSNEYTNIKLDPFRGRWNQASAKLAGLKTVKCGIRIKKILKNIKHRLPLIRTDRQLQNKHKLLTLFLDFDKVPPIKLGGNTEVYLTNEKVWKIFEDELKKYLPEDKFLFTRSISNKVKVISTLDISYRGNVKLDKDLYNSVVDFLTTYYKLPKIYTDVIDCQGMFVLGIPNENTFNIIKERLPKLEPLVLDNNNNLGFRTLNPNTPAPSYCSSYTGFQDEDYESLNEIDPRPVVIDQEPEDNYKDVNDFDTTKYHCFEGDDLPIKIKSRSKLDPYLLKILLCTPQLLIKYDLSGEKLAQQIGLLFGYKCKQQRVSDALIRFQKKGLLTCVDHYYDKTKAKAKSYEASGKLRAYLLSGREKQNTYKLNDNRPDTKISLGGFQKVRNYAYRYFPNKFPNKIDEYELWKNEVIKNTPEHKKEERRKQIEYDIKRVIKEMSC